GEALPGRLPRADRDERLDDVPARTLRIGVRIEERRESGLLVRLQQSPDQRERREAHGYERRELPGPRAREVRHPEEDADEHEARAEVGLLVDERERGRQEHERAAEDER